MRIYYIVRFYFNFPFCRLLLRREGVNLRTTAEFEVVRTLKERTCYLSPNPQREESVDTERMNYTLPDGHILEVSIWFFNYTSLEVSIS